MAIAGSILIAGLETLVEYAPAPIKPVAKLLIKLLKVLLDASDSSSNSPDAQGVDLDQLAEKLNEIQVSIQKLFLQNSILEVDPLVPAGSGEIILSMAEVLPFCSKIELNGGMLRTRLASNMMEVGPLRILDLSKEHTIEFNALFGPWDYNEAFDGALLRVSKRTIELTMPNMPKKYGGKSLPSDRSIVIDPAGENPVVRATYGARKFTVRFQSMPPGSCLPGSNIVIPDTATTNMTIDGFKSRSVILVGSSISRKRRTKH